MTDRARILAFVSYIPIIGWIYVWYAHRTETFVNEMTYASYALIQGKEMANSPSETTICWSKIVSGSISGLEPSGMRSIFTLILPSNRILGGRFCNDIATSPVMPARLPSTMIP
jgi:hypothetical protein